MKNITKTILAVLAAGLVSSALSTHEVQAAQINGTIDFAGAVFLDSSNLDNATQVQLWRDVFGNLGFSNVAAVRGDFSGIFLGTQATMHTPWIFDPSTDTPALWMVGGFTFNLMSATVVDQTAEVLNITGTGMITAAGFDDTFATWAFTVQNAGGDHDFFSFSANAGTGAATPTPTPTPTPTSCSTPAAPRALEATNVTASSFTANWSSVSGATGYRLDVCDKHFTNCVYQDLDVGNTTSYNVIGLSAGTTYYYRLRAYNGNCTSPNSNVTKVKTDKL